MNKTYVDAVSNQDDNESAIMRKKNYNPPNLLFQHLPVKEKVKKIQVNRMRNGYILDTLTSVANQEIVTIGGKMIESYEGVIYRKNFKKSPIGKVIEELSALRQKYKQEHNDLMPGSVKLIKNSLYVRRDIDEFYKCISEHWMPTEYDENVLDNWRLPNVNYNAKFKKDDGLDGDNEVENTLLSQLGASILSNSKQIMNNFFKEINEF